MAKLILHTKPDLEAIAQRRMLEDILLTVEERRKKENILMAFANSLKDAGPMGKKQDIESKAEKKKSDL